MVEKRIKILIFFCGFFLVIFFLRIAGLQLASNFEISKKIAELKRQYGRSRQTMTIRGKILDRNGKILAEDLPVFELYLNYDLSSVLDPRVAAAKLLTAQGSANPQKVQAAIVNQLLSDKEVLNLVFEKCVRFGAGTQELEEKIRTRNNQIWNLRLFQAWRKNCTQTELYKQFQDNLAAVKLADFTDDFEKNYPDPNDRLEQIGAIDIAEMREDWPLMQLATDDDVIAAEIEFMNISACKIKPRAIRTYPFGSIAAQTIGWVSLPQQKDIKMFADDRYSRYLSGEVSGREGAEYVYESILRGKRGEVYRDADGNEVRLDTQFGKDVRLSIDIELQGGIEKFLTNYNLPADTGPGMSAVIIDVATGQILAMVSVPTYDLNRVRNDYGDLINDKSRPLTNRALNELYPPGSSVKPVILIAGMQSGNITAEQTIECRPTPGWPQCWVTKQYGRTHGPVNARNAIKGSCNVYFSHLADKIDADILQRWLFGFGYGRRILPPFDDPDNEVVRNFSQAGGIVSSTRPTEIITNSEKLPPLADGEKRLFGLGQGNLRATPLQVANAMAAIARGGVFLEPKLFIGDINNIKYNPVSLGISQATLDTVFDGMRAVVNEPEGTAYNAFSRHRFSSSGVTVYGKTGSTEAPEHAWFAGFARDNFGRTIAMSLIVEGGKSGGNVAAPIGAEIINICIESGLIGRNSR